MSARHPRTILRTSRVVRATLWTSSALSMAIATAAVVAVAQQPGADPTQDPGQPGQAARPGDPNGTNQAGDLAQNPAEKARRANTVVKAGARRITVGEIEDAINAQSPFLRVRYQEPERLREFVDQMVRFELLARAADARGYGTNDAVVRSTKQNAVQQLMKRQIDERITPESIPESDVRAYFDSHPQEFRREAMVRASHIQVASRDEALEMIRRTKNADARAFREIAREHSIDPETKLRGGDLRYFNSEGRAPNANDPHVDENLVEAAFGLRDVGDITTTPVEVEGNFSVVMLTGRRDEEVRSFEQADQGVRLRLWRERRQQAIEDLVEGLRTSQRPQIFNERLGPIQLDLAPAGGGHDGFPPGGRAGEPGTGDPAASDPAAVNPAAANPSAVTPTGVNVPALPAADEATSEGR